MKILFYCSYPKQTNGYARIGNNITNFLASQENVEIYYFGITASENNSVARFVHPKINLINVIQESPSQDPFGFDLIETKIQEIKPDIVFLYNDILVLSKIIFNLNKNIPERNFKIYTYIDLVYLFEHSDIISLIDKSTDKFFVFSQVWKTNLIDIGIQESKVFILHHGLDSSKIFKIKQSTARDYLNLNEDDFIISNLNRNTHRKGIDFTIQAFVKFLKTQNANPKIKLFLNGIQEPSSYPIYEILKIECFKHKLNVEQVLKFNILTNLKMLSDSEINYLYNATDVGINTCFGEGFGLCNLEHASVGKPQIVTKTGGLQDIFDKGHVKLIEPVVTIYNPTALEHTGGYLEIGRVEDFVDAIKYYYLNQDKKEEDGLFYEKNIPIKYDWNRILKEFYEKHILTN